MGRIETSADDCFANALCLHRIGLPPDRDQYEVRAIVMQKKTQRPVQFELTEQTRDSVAAWIAAAHLKPEQYLFPSRMSKSPHVSTRCGAPRRP